MEADKDDSDSFLTKEEVDKVDKQKKRANTDEFILGRHSSKPSTTSKVQNSPTNSNPNKMVAVKELEGLMRTKKDIYSILAHEGKLRLLPAGRKLSWNMMCIENLLNGLWVMGMNECSWLVAYLVGRP